MAEAFPVSGNIDPTSFPRLLVDLNRRGATGSLKVTGSVHPKALYYRGGRVLFGSSNDPRDQLGAILIESGRITREQLDDVNSKVGPGNPLAKVLAESGYVNQRELGDAARVKVERILADVLSWESGTFEFEDGVLPKGAVDLKLSTERLLLAAVLRIADRPFALRHLGEIGVVLEPAPEGEAALSEVRAEVWPLLERLDGRRTLKDAIALTRLDEFEGAKMACAMLFLEIVKKKSTGQEAGEELDLAHEVRMSFGEETRAEASPPPPPAAAPEAALPAFPLPEPTSEPAEPPVFLSEPAPEPAGFAMVEPGSESAETAMFTEPLPPFPPTETVPPAPTPAPFYPSPRRVGAETLPGSRPVESREPIAPALAPTDTLSEAETAAFVPLPEVPAPKPLSTPAPPPPPSSRPTEEDLAALDALLNPSASRASRVPEALGRPPFRPHTARTIPRPEPPLRLGGPSGSARRAPARGAGPSAVSIIAGLAVLGAVGFGGWYLFLRVPTAPAVEPTPGPVALATPVAAAVPTMTPSALGSSIPAPSAATATPAAPVAVPAAPPPTPVPSPAARPAPTNAPPPASGLRAGSVAQRALRQGSFPEAARAFAAELRSSSRGAVSAQLLVACAPETVQKAVDAASSQELFILPVAVRGRPCYRVCWGVYENEARAENGLRQLPSYFRQGGAVPRLQTLAELLR